MIEVGVVINQADEAIFWHLPPGRTAGSIPDSRQLWNVLWDNRESLLGFAHSHPGYGIPRPSYTDVSTFFAVEQALGRRLQWWITSADRLTVCTLLGESPPRYGSVEIIKEPTWTEQLRFLSGTSLQVHGSQLAIQGEDYE